MRRPLLIAAIGLALLAGGCTGGDGPEIGVGTVVRADVVELVNAPATVLARAQATLTAPADGTVAEVLVDDGEAVLAGVPILRIDSPTAQARLLQSRAAQQAVAGGDADTRLQAVAAVAIAQRAVDALTVKAPIAGTVQLGGAGSAASGGGLDDLIGQLPPAVQGEAAASLGGGAGGSATVTSVAEIVRGVPVQQGTVLAMVFDLSVLSLVAEVDETDILLVRRGIAARAELDAVPGATYDATVRSVELAPTTSTRGGVTYRVLLALAGGRTLDDAAAPLPRPGMSAVVDLRVREDKAAITVPAAAIVRQGARDAVWVVRDGRATAQLVTLGAQGDDVVAVTKGLREGERVVVRGADVVREGQQV